MAKYSDDDIREMKKITLQIAGQYLGIAPLAVALGMRNRLDPLLWRISFLKLSLHRDTAIFSQPPLTWGPWYPCFMGPDGASYS
ncbi:hypothetical protein [Phosphitispora fastidiosa]|uniref:hypothetical protein n=1 Tax=Phosphitispora fastidiosa TaxID=2837202 RepID=UPI001E36B2BB|nr:hypothetical protein [Phosphitispora fastidiosa]MBU7006186.1 hypothetical protein [Phosphitispora fastidiosa]